MKSILSEKKKHLKKVREFKWPKKNLFKNNNEAMLFWIVSRHGKWEMGNADVVKYGLEKCLFWRLEKVNNENWMTKKGSRLLDAKKIE